MRIWTIFRWNYNSRLSCWKRLPPGYKTLHKKWSFLLRISSVNVTKFAGNWIRSQLLLRSLMENFIFCVVRRKLNVHKIFRRQLLNVSCTSNLRSASREYSNKVNILDQFKTENFSSISCRWPCDEIQWKVQQNVS